MCASARGRGRDCTAPVEEFGCAWDLWRSPWCRLISKVQVGADACAAINKFNAEDGR